MKKISIAITALSLIFFPICWILYEIIRGPGIMGSVNPNRSYASFYLIPIIIPLVNIYLLLRARSQVQFKFESIFWVLSAVITAIPWAAVALFLLNVGKFY
jgi:hypothetical protein